MNSILGVPEGVNSQVTESTRVKLLQQDSSLTQLHTKIYELEGMNKTLNMKLKELK